MLFVSPSLRRSHLCPSASWCMSRWTLSLGCPSPPPLLSALSTSSSLSSPLPSSLHFSLQCCRTVEWTWRGQLNRQQSLNMSECCTFDQPIKIRRKWLELFFFIKLDCVCCRHLQAKKERAAAVYEFMKFFKPVNLIEHNCVTLTSHPY